MMNKIGLLALSLLFVTVSAFGYSTSYFSKYPHQLEVPIKKLLAFSKAKSVLQAAQKEGPISVKLSPFNVSTSNAMWRSDMRAIILNSQKKRSEGEVIRSVLFELHNALNHHKFVVLDKKARSNLIDKEAYVRGIEKIEHQNALQTMNLLEEAIRLGVYPKSANWPIIRNFEDHYKVQQLSGHSQYIASVYDSINPNSNQTAYNGTIMAQTLDAQQKTDLMRSISRKDLLRYG